MAWSRFYGTVKGRTGEASRLGNEDSGLHVAACAKSGRIDVRLQAMADGRDKYWVSMRQHGSSQGWEGEIASGVMGVKPETEVGVLPVPTLAALVANVCGAKAKPRRPYRDDAPDSDYQESDKDYVGNNMELCVALLDTLTGAA